MNGTAEEKLKRTEESRIDLLKENNKLKAAIRKAIKCFVAQPMDYDNGMIELYNAIRKKPPLKLRIRTEMVKN